MSLTGCSFSFTAEPAIKPQVQAAPFVTSTPPDRWVEWTANVSPAKATSVAERLALADQLIGSETKFQLPNGFYTDRSWVGISQFRQNCLVGLLRNRWSDENMAYSVTVMSRYNYGTEKRSPWSSDPAALGAMINHYADWCGGGALPADFVMNPASVAPDPYAVAPAP